MTIETINNQYVIRVDQLTLSIAEVEQALQPLRTLVAARQAGTEAEVTHFVYPHLDPQAHGVVLDFGIPDDEITGSSPFADIADAGAYVREQRNQSWQ